MRNVHVRRIGRDAGLAALRTFVGLPQDRVVPVDALDGRAARPRHPLVARRKRRIHEVVAARPLQQVAARRRHVAQLRRRAREQRLRQQRIVRRRCADGSRGRELRTSAPIITPPAGASSTRVSAGSGSRLRRPACPGAPRSASSGRQDWCRRPGTWRRVRAMARSGFRRAGRALIRKWIHAEAPVSFAASCGRAYGSNNVGVGSAAADVSAHALPDLVIRQLRRRRLARSPAHLRELPLLRLVQQRRAPSRSAPACSIRTGTRHARERPPAPARALRCCRRVRQPFDRGHLAPRPRSRPASGRSSRAGHPPAPYTRRTGHGRSPSSSRSGPGAPAAHPAASSGCPASAVCRLPLMVTWSCRSVAIPGPAWRSRRARAGHASRNSRAHRTGRDHKRAPREAGTGPRRSSAASVSGSIQTLRREQNS